MSYTATYSPDDNKLRLYAASRLSPELYARVKAHGFRWAPRQELFVAPMWTPAREDLLIELAGQVDDEDKSLTERADERAERFEDYSEKRAGDADAARRAVSAIADNIPLGQPILVGHHSEKHARRDAEKIENGMRRAVKMWETSRYWTDRAAGAISHAKYKERPDVRARRIKTIEAERRKVQRNCDDAALFTKLWSRLDDEGLVKRTDGAPVTKLDRAKYIANRDHISKCFTLAEFPRTPPTSQYEGAMSLWSALEGGVISADQARDIAIRVHERGNNHRARWLAHFDNRLAYERALLGETGYIVPPKNPTRAALPLLNYSGTVEYQRRYHKGETIKSEAHGMTAAEYAAINSDYKGTFISADGTHRVRSAYTSTGKPGERSLVAVYLTDKKQHPRPGSGSEDSRDQAEVNVRVRKGQDQLAASLKRHADVKAHNRVVIDAADEEPAAVREFFDAHPEVAQANAESFQAMKESLRAGVQVVTANQLFPTPAHLAERMVELAGVEDGHRLLEPSAGTGELLAAVGRARVDCKAVAVEINSRLAEGLRARFMVNVDTRCADFLKLNGELGEFDRVLMNPPFQNADDIKHVSKAAGMLKPGGRLVGICANGPRQNDILRPLVQAAGGLWEELPEDTFRGTGVRAVLFTYDKPEEESCR